MWECNPIRILCTTELRKHILDTLFERVIKRDVDWSEAEEAVIVAVCLGEEYDYLDKLLLN